MRMLGERGLLLLGRVGSINVIDATGVGYQNLSAAGLGEGEKLLSPLAKSSWVTPRR